MSTLKANTIKPVAVSTDLQIQTNDTTRMTLSAADGLIKLPTSAPGIQFGDGMIQQYAGGKVRQIAYAYTDIADSFSSESLLVTGLQVNITPRDTNSKILIFAMLSVGGSSNDNVFDVGVRRGSVDIGLGIAGNNRARGLAGVPGVGDNRIHTVSMSYMDAPNSTSELTYKVTCSNRSGYISYINRTANDSDNQYTVRPGSTITVMEVVTGA